MRLNVNGNDVSVTTDEERPLLDVLREELFLTGTKYGCGEGECGACTVLMGNAAVCSCITSIGEAQGEKIRTIEIDAGLDEAGAMTAWDFTNYNSGRSAIDTPYRVPHGRTRFVTSDSPLRQGSYRARFNGQYVRPRIDDG